MIRPRYSTCQGTAPRNASSSRRTSTISLLLDVSKPPPDFPSDIDDWVIVFSDTLTQPRSEQYSLFNLPCKRSTHLPRSGTGSFTQVQPWWCRFALLLPCLDHKLRGRCIFVQYTKCVMRRCCPNTHALCLRYGWTPDGLPSHCPDGNAFTVEHALSCPRGGYIALRHNEIRDVLAEHMQETCCNVATEPKLQPLSGEVFEHRTAVTADGARLDIRADGFWATRHEVAYFDVFGYSIRMQRRAFKNR